MPRPRNTTELSKLHKRWLRLSGFVKRLHSEMVRPMNNTQRKSTVVICGRIINMLVCVFAVSDTLTNKVMHELNSCLMRLDGAQDVQAASSLELEIIDMLARDIGSKIAGIVSEIEAANYSASSSS